jgi:general secretion pathway protein I
MTAAPPRQAGFTLLEVLVALAILSLAVVASIQGFAQGLRLLKLAGDHQQAMLLADQKVREIVNPVEGQDSGIEGSFRWERTTKALEGAEIAQPGTPQAVPVYEIDVRVSWDPRRQIEIRTLRMATSTSTTTTSVTTTSPTGSTTSPSGSRTSPTGSTPFGGRLQR